MQKFQQELQAYLLHDAPQNQLLLQDPHLLCPALLERFQLFHQRPLQVQQLLTLLLIAHPEFAPVVFQTLLSRVPAQSQQSMAKMLINLLQTFPLQSRTLLSAVEQMFPYKTCPREHHHQYVKFMIYICREQPRLRVSLLEIMFERLLLIDTQIKATDQSQKNKNLKDKIEDAFLVINRFIDELFSIRSQQTRLVGEFIRIYVNKMLPVKDSQFMILIFFRLVNINQQFCMNFISQLLRISLKEERHTPECILNSVWLLNDLLLKSVNIQKRIVLQSSKLVLYKLIDFYTKVDAISMKEFNHRKIYKQFQVQFTLLQFYINLLFNFNQVFQGQSEQPFLQLIQLAYCKSKFMLFLPDRTYDMLLAASRQLNFKRVSSFIKEQIREQLMVMRWNQNDLHSFPERLNLAMVQGELRDALLAFIRCESEKDHQTDVTQPKRRKLTHMKSVFSLQ